MTEYIISARELGKLRIKAGLHVWEILEMTCGKVVRCKDCRECQSDEDGDLWCMYFDYVVEADGFCDRGW